MTRIIDQLPGKIFVVFRQFDSSPYHASPEELIAGWTDLGKDQVDTWVDEMNGRIRTSLSVKSAEQSPQKCEDSEPRVIRRNANPRLPSVDVTFSLRTTFPGTPDELVTRIQRLLGCQFRVSDNPVYSDDDSAFETVALGLLVRLVECPAVGSYPKRFHLVGNPNRDDLPNYKASIDLTSYLLEYLTVEGMDWYVPTADELRVESGL